MEGAKQILKALMMAGYEAYIVGGSVRDILLGKIPKDIDIATNARPDRVKQILQACGMKTTDLVGKAFGVIVACIGGASYEVATYRREVYALDSHRPSEIWYSDSLQEDVGRRDFTMNALAMDIEGHIIDYVGGQKDIRRGVIRAIGDPLARFQEDALRVCRACRFAGQLGFAIDKKTWEAMPKSLERVDGLSLDRIVQEWDKTLLSPYASRGVDLWVRSGITNRTCVVRKHGEVEQVAILPELTHLVGLVQDARFHAHDAWQHTLVALQHVPPDITLRYAALFHDVGKGLEGVRAYGRRITDHGHDERGSRIALEVLTRLQYPKKMAQRVSWMVKSHMRFHFMAQHEEANMMRWIRKEARSKQYRNKEELREAFRQLVQVCAADIIATGRMYSSTDGLFAFGEYVQALIDNMPVGTKDLRYDDALLCMIQGHESKVFSYLLQGVQNGCMENTEEALKNAAKKYMAKHVSVM